MAMEDSNGAINGDGGTRGGGGGRGRGRPSGRHPSRFSFTKFCYERSFSPPLRKVKNASNERNQSGLAAVYICFHSCVFVCVCVCVCVLGYFTRE